MLIAVALSIGALVYAVRTGNVLAVGIATLALILAVAGLVWEVNRRER